MPFFEILPLLNAGWSARRRGWSDKRRVVFNGQRYVALDEFNREALTQPDWSYEMQLTDWYVEEKC